MLSLAHALERHKTLSGDDVVAVLEKRLGPIVDGRIYGDPAFVAELEAYHEAAVEAHRRHAIVAVQMPAPRLPDNEVVQGELVDVDERTAAAAEVAWPPASGPYAPRAEGTPNGSQNGSSNGSRNGAAHGTGNGTTDAGPDAPADDADDPEEDLSGRGGQAPPA